MKTTDQLGIPGQETLSVRELIEALQALPPEAMDLPVFTEGCDCHGTAYEVALNEDNVLIMRDESQS